MKGPRCHLGLGRPPRSDRGAVLVLVALCMLALMLIVALVIDLGSTRSDRRAGQMAVDSAATAAAQSYKVSEDPADACREALALLALNLDTAPFVGDGGTTCASQFGSATCADITPRSLTARSGDYVVVMQHPVLAGSELMVNTSTIGNAGIPQDATADGEGCDRFGFQVTTTGGAFFGGVAGESARSSTVHAVAMVRARTENTEVAALLLLERVGCGVLQTSGGGATGSGVIVSSPSPTLPGIIAADSAGQVPPCTTNANADGYVIFGTALPAAGGGGPSITAEDASATVPGIISIYAKGVGGRGGYVYPGGLSVEPIAGAINSRSIADTRYNGTNTQISQLHALLNSRTAAPPTTGTFATITGNPECKGTLPAATLDATVVFVDCPTFEPEANLFPNATHFFVRGNINIKSNKKLSLPEVQNLFVRGCSVGGCSGSNQFALEVANNGVLYLNTGDPALPATDTGGTPCSARRSAARGGSTSNTTRFATRGGSVTVSGFVRMCQTTLYVGEDSAAYTKQTVEVTAAAPENYPAIAKCTPAKPCPKDSAATMAGISFTGGSASADWSAPDQLATRPTTAQLAYAANPFEDLAFWSETSAASNIRGQGNNTTTGVFILPNASFTFTGQGTQAQPLDAQFLVRRLNVSGQGSLVMEPDPANALEVEVYGNVSLIR